MKPQVSIIISSHNRLPLFRRSIWATARRIPKLPTEVIVVDDGSTEDVLGELRLYSSIFAWKFIRFDREAFEKQTGLKKFLNNPCATNNIGFKASQGEIIIQQGNEVIPWEGCYDKLIADAPDAATWMVMSTTYDLPKQYLDLLDEYGANLTPGLVKACERWPLQSWSYPSDVTNYVSAASRATWEALRGYDERYYGGISAEDSDFVRRGRCLPGFKQAISFAVSLHQFHNGKTTYYDPPPSVITKERWNEGVAINHAVYHSWDETARNPTKWAWGELGVGEVITSGY